MTIGFQIGVKQMMDIINFNQKNNKTLLQNIVFRDFPFMKFVDSTMSSNFQFATFINQLISRKQYKSYLKKATKQYDILKYKIIDITVCDIKRMYGKILLKYTNTSDSQNTQEMHYEDNSWLINQLKTFVWIAVCYAGYHDQHLASLTQKGWNFLLSIFPFKPFEILQFQILSLLKGQSIRSPKKWSKPEEQLLKHILRDPSLDGKWNQISKQFFIQSDKKYFRKPQKCREHWYNHLNPAISHEPWSIQEDLILIQNVNSKGKKWSEISLSMGGQRTEHMVKNRYKSLEKRYDIEIKKSSSRQLDASMIHKNFHQGDEEVLKVQLKKNESIMTCEDEKIIFEMPAEFPTNIEETSLEMQSSEEEKMNVSLRCYLEQHLIEVADDKFFNSSKKSISLLSEFDDQMQIYVESPLF